MEYGINAGFGDPIAHDVNSLIRQGFSEIRQDLQYIKDADVLQARLEELRFSAIRPLWIMRPDQVSQARACERVELLNEPNLHKVTPQGYAQDWNLHGAPAQQRGVIVFAGSISNLTRDVLSWWQQSWKLMDIKPTHVSVHRYPRDAGFSQPHQGFGSRQEEVTALRDIIGNAVVSVTEFGYHTGARKKWGFWSTRWSDIQCAAFAKREWQFWAQQTGVESAYIYQLNDGPTNTTLDRYGIRRLDGSWKPSADAHRS